MKHGTKCEYMCSDRCTDCKSSSLCTGCIPGRYGSTCQLLCPQGCTDILCDTVSGEYTSGYQHGYYQDGVECYTCPAHCMRCTDATHCAGCDIGCYDSYCQNACPSYCKNQNCEIDTSVCFDACIYGYYIGRDACVACNHRCMSCADETMCTSCVTGEEVTSMIVNIHVFDVVRLMVSAFMVSSDCLLNDLYV